ncbi:phage tail tape measure protein [Streptomyces sp. NPDC006703]|uniref:phage tail tape measure protein n=1 Tax=Streptomyces sp. NPDC006703 TaxID=3364759 RepID=UPI00368D7C65
MGSGYNLYVNLLATTGGLTGGLRQGAAQLRQFDGQLSATTGRLNQVQAATQRLARTQQESAAQMVASQGRVARATQLAGQAQQQVTRIQRAQQLATTLTARAQEAQAAASTSAAAAQATAARTAAAAQAAQARGAANAATLNERAARAQAVADRYTAGTAATQVRAAQATREAERATRLAATSSGRLADAEARALSAVAGRDEAMQGAARTAQAAQRAEAEATAALASARQASIGRSLQGGLVLGAALGVGVHEAIELERLMANVLTISQQITGDNVAQYTDRIVELSTRLPQTASQLAEGLYQVVSTGFDGAQAMSILEVAAQGASAGLTTTETSARALLGVLKAYGMDASQASSVMDTMFQTVNVGVISFEELAQQLGDVVPMAAAAGVNFEDLSSAFAAVTLAGIPAAESATALNMLMTRMMKPTAELRNMFKELGYESASTALQQDGLYVVMEKIRAKTGGTAAEVVPLLKDIRAVRAALALGAADGRNYAATFNAISVETNRARATQKAFDIQMGTTAGQWSLFKNEASALGIDLGRAVLPVLRSVGEAMKVFASVANDAPGGLKTSVAYLLAFGAAALIARAGVEKVSMQIAGFRSNLAAMRAGGAAMPVVLSGVGLAVSGLTALLTVGTLAYAAYAASKQKAKDATEELVTALQSERGQDGVAGAGIRKLAEQLVTSGDLDKLEKVGVTVEQAVDAIKTGGKTLRALQDDLAWKGSEYVGDPSGGGSYVIDEKHKKAMQILEDRGKWWDAASKKDAEITSAMNAMSAKIRDAQSNYNGAWALDKLISTDGKGKPQYSDEMKALAKAIDDVVDPSRALKNAQQEVAESMRKAGKNTDDAKASLAGYLEELRKQSRAQGAFQQNMAKLALADGGAYQQLVDHFASLGQDGAGVLDELVQQLGKGQRKNADELLKIIELDTARAQETYRKGLEMLPEIAARYGKQTAEAWAEAAATNDPGKFQPIMQQMALSDLGKAVQKSTAGARGDLQRGMRLIAETAQTGGKEAAERFRTALMSGDIKQAQDALTAIWGPDKPISAPDLSNVVTAFRTAGSQAQQEWSGMLELILQAAATKGPAAASALTSALLSGDMQAVKNLLDAIGISVSTIPDTKQVTVNVTTNQPPPVVISILYRREPLANDADGNGISDYVQAPKKQANGAIMDFYADGGVRGRQENHVAQIAPAGSWRVWGEPETMGEGYVPFNPSKRPRSRAITEEIVRRLGGDPSGIQWNANGGLTNWSYKAPSLLSVSGIASDSKDKDGKFDLSLFARKLHDSVGVATRWRQDLATVASRAGTDVARALEAMGEDGVDLVHKMATGSKKYLDAMAADLRHLADTAKASLADYTHELDSANTVNAVFQRNLIKLAGLGFGDLATQLAAQNDETAQQLAAQSVTDRGKASRANEQAKVALAQLTAEETSEVVQIVAAITSDKVGIHQVADVTGLGEDEIIKVIAKAGRQVRDALGGRGAKFLADLFRAQQGLSYADGGVLTPGLYATSGGIIRFAEPETHGEAFIPLGAAQRRSATAVLTDVANRFGYQLTAAGATGPIQLTDARPTQGVRVVVVQSPAALIGTQTINVDRPGATEQQIAAAIGYQVRRAQRGGVRR